VRAVREGPQGRRADAHEHPLLPPAGDGARRGDRSHRAHGHQTRFGHEIKSLEALLKEGFDAVFIGTGAPKGKDLDIPAARKAKANIHIGIDWLTSVAFEHVTPSASAWS
jgi:hypothetical protein